MAHFTCNFISYVLDRAVSVNVIIPSVTSTEAEDPNVTHKPRWKYPVMYLLHGYCNDYSTWERYTSIERYAEERRIAVVTFSAENNMYMRLEDVKEKNPIPKLMEPDYETFLMKELPDFVTSMFPISEKPSDTYIAGLSMGGYGAMCHGFRNPRRFRAIGAFSPAVTGRTDYRESSVVPDYLKKYEPWLLVEQAAKAEDEEMPAFYYCYGDQDFLWDSQEWFREKLEELQITYTLDVVNGYGHEWAFWDMQVEKFLDWIPRTDPYYEECPKRRI